MRQKGANAIKSITKTCIRATYVRVFNGMSHAKQNPLVKKNARLYM